MAVADIPVATPRAAALGLAACTALVIGNMVGSGFFIAPSALAPYGTTALFGWAVMAVGAMCLGWCSRAWRASRRATGGPYAYTRDGLRPVRRLPDRVGLLDLHLGLATPRWRRRLRATYGCSFLRWTATADPEHRDRAWGNLGGDAQ